jgi:hypothetical protein
MRAWPNTYPWVYYHRTIAEFKDGRVYYIAKARKVLPCGRVLPKRYGFKTVWQGEPFA